LFGKRWSGQRRIVERDTPLGSLLDDVRRSGASDLHLVSGQPARLRIDGRLQARGAPVSDEAIEDLFGECLTLREREQLRRRAATDLSVRLAGGDGGRFRVNLHRQSGRDAAAIRALPNEIPTLQGLQLPPELASLVEQENGLVLVCGPTGSGKSSTLAALVDGINHRRPVHIITIEEPVEYEYRPDKALIEQVEIGIDAPSFPEALRAALRQDPDVILLGEMRDLESLSTALTAAETGHLILSTLHTTDAGQSIHRIVDLYPEASQNQIRQQLAMSLNAVVCQRLLPRIDGPGVVPAVEILRASFPVRQHIRTGQVQKIYNELTMGRKHGMISLEASLARLVVEGKVSQEEALLRSRRPEELTSLLRHG
jgi:twitching motility protein PilT